MGVLQNFQKFRVRVWKCYRTSRSSGYSGTDIQNWASYRTSRSFGYGYRRATELPEVPGIVAQTCRTLGVSGRVQSMLYAYPGYCGTGRTELAEVPSTGMKVLQNTQKFRARV